MPALATPALATPARRATDAVPDVARLAQLKAARRKPGEASFFWYDPHFQSIAVKVLPGEYFVHDDDVLVMTTLGSCIAACLWDRTSGIGGLNHFMLPEGASDDGRYGAYAMELLINEMMKLGASRHGLEAKVFGGGQVISGMDTMNVGERNTKFVIDYLQTERIPVVSKDVLDIYARKVCFMPKSGKAMVKRLASTNTTLLAERERTARAASAASGSVDLF